MRRSRLPHALLLSLALHGALGLLLYRAPVPRLDLVPPRSEVVEMELFEPPTPKPPAPVQRPSTPPRAEVSPSRSAPRVTTRTPPPAAPSPAPPAPSHEPPASSAPSTASPPAPSDTPQVLRLYPGMGGLAVSPNLGLPPGTPSGHTLHPGDEPTPGQLLAEERERVHGRVQGFVEDDLATGIVENGLADTFFGDMHRAMDKGLTGAPLFSYQGVLKHFFKPNPQANQLSLRDVFAGAGHYGATGAPDPINEPTGQSLEDAVRSGTLGARARTRPSMAESLEAQSRVAQTLHAELELEQSHTGQVLSVKLIVSSGNPLFDAYVLDNVPKSLEALGEAPEHFAAHTKKEQIRSAWSVDGHVSFSRTLKVSKLHQQLNASDAAYLSALIPLGLLSGNFDELTGDIVVPDIRRPHFEIRTRLLRVY